MTLVLFLNEIADHSDRIAQVGGKARNLGRLLQAGFPVPLAFCLTIDAYRHHLSANNLTDEIRALLSNPNLSEADKASLVQQLIVDAGLPLDLRQTIIKAYHQLSNGEALLPVAIRSSATSEDAALTSFAGQHDTFLDIRGQTALLVSVKRCWVSLWTARSLSYRGRLQPDDPDAGLAVIVQRMVPAKNAGVVFTINPLTGAEEVIIEAVAGLGERLVSGGVTPDRYRIDKQTWRVAMLELAAFGRQINVCGGGIEGDYAGLSYLTVVQLLEEGERE